MQILEASKDKVSLEMSREEYLNLDAIVMTANLSQRSLDMTAYGLDGQKLKQIVNGFAEMMDVLEAKRLNGKRLSLTKD